MSSKTSDINAAIKSAPFCSSAFAMYKYVTAIRILTEQVAVIHLLRSPKKECLAPACRDNVTTAVIACVTQDSSRVVGRRYCS